MSLVIATSLLSAVYSDMYMHNARGSNNRLDEANRDRNNGNRLFDSQNNNRGGSNVGSLYYYVGEKLALEWTNQHGCGSSQAHCEIVVQYMCDDRLRDGVTTRTIPETPSQCQNYDCNNDVRFGMHEDYDYYMNCKYRYRNMGLFTADRQLNGRTARFTRQNNNGNRRGYECPEERDHYPYWHPTPWIDLAVYTNEPEKCEFYETESENVKGRYRCKLPDTWYHHMVRNGGGGNNGFIPNTEALCNQLNQEGSAMSTFISELANDDATSSMVAIEEEMERCMTAQENLKNGCPQDENGIVDTTANTLSCQIARQEFLAGGKTLTSLNSEIKLCSEGQVLHPHADCPRCGPASCTFTAPVGLTRRAREAHAMEIMVEVTCPDGFVADRDAEGHLISEMCISSDCATQPSRKRRDGHAAAVDENGEVMAPEFMGPVSAFAEGLVSGDKLREAEQVAVEFLGPSGFTVDTIPAASNLPVGQCVKRNSLSVDCSLKSNRATWELVPPHNTRFPDLKAPVCKKSQWSRANHLGNGIGGQQNGHNFTIPDHVHEHCVIRTRYNITTTDYAGLDPHNPAEVNAMLNRRQNGAPARVDIGGDFRLAKTDTRRPEDNFRGYLFEGNPQVSIFNFHKVVRFCDNVNLVMEGNPTLCTNPNNAEQPTLAYSVYCPAGYDRIQYDAAGVPTGRENNCANIVCISDDVNKGPVTNLKALQCNAGDLNVNQLRDTNTGDDDNNGNKDTDFKLQLAINTAQFGRTFQDRSHSFAMREVPSDIKSDCRRILALNVRGKRGNIVQTFPGTEYDFVPNILEVAQGDCIHFQWTGSNTNPNNNDGQGKQGTDRSNWALLEKNRGEGNGGRGVQVYGGKGKDGTTWTTLNMEPGYENFEFNQVPTLADLQCDSAFRNEDNDLPTVNNVPYGGWQHCSNCVPEDFKPTMGDNQCMDGYEYNSNRNVCVDKTKNCRFNSRPKNPTSFTGIGVVPEDPGFMGYSFDQVGVLEDQKFGQWGNSHPEHLDNVTKWNVLGLSYSEALNLISLDNVQFRGEMSELDDAGTYFDLKPHKVTGPIGVYYYLCTRNNNFSNRSQKGKIVVSKAIEETNSCGPTGCNIGVSTQDAMPGDVGSETAVFETSQVKLSIPPKSIQSFEVVAVKLVQESGLSSASSDVLLVGPGNLKSEKVTVPIMLNPEATEDARKRRDGHAMQEVPTSMQEQVDSIKSGEMESGIWASADKINGTAALLYLRSPNSMILEDMQTMQRRELNQWPDDKRFSPYACVSLSSGSDTITVVADIDGRAEILTPIWFGDTGFEWIEKLLEGDLWIDITFPGVGELSPDMKDDSSLKTCSGLKFMNQVPIDEESGQPISVEIPVAPAIAYGDVYWWPVNSLTQACFERGEKCDQALQMSDREVVEGAKCGGGSCEFKRSQTGGYYQVSSKDDLPIIAAVATVCVLLAIVFVGSAVYFRKNPEKWEGVKAWAPKKYKLMKRSLQSSV